MLFDLKGRRRIFIQVIYVTLAILMGGGLVLFGIGGDANGGLFDAFSGNSGGPTDSQFQDQLDQANQALAANPEDEGALVRKVRANYQLALENANPETGAPTAKSRAYLEDADRTWNAYLELNPESPQTNGASPSSRAPDPSIASLMVQAYSEGALGEPVKAAKAAGLVAEARSTTAAYLLLTRYAAQAGDDRTAALAAKKAVSLAPATQRKTVQEQVDQVTKAGEQAAKQSKTASEQQGGTATTGASGTSGQGGGTTTGGGPAPK